MDLLTPRKKPVKLTTADMHTAMAKKWCAPEWAIMWEVGEGTGAMGGRYADAVMMSLWPSRGLELHGVEIKVSRADWKREAADPTKAEAIAKYCDRWWIHTPAGIIQDLSELPPAWGLREYDGRCWRTIREAEKTESVPMTRRFLAAMLRRADGAMARMVDEVTRGAREAARTALEAERARMDEQIKTAVARRTQQLEQGAEELAAFRAAFGGHTHDWRDHNDPKALGAAARALVNVSKGYGSLIERLRKAADEIEALQSITDGKDHA